MVTMAAMAMHVGHWSWDELLILTLILLAIYGLSLIKGRTKIE